MIVTIFLGNGAVGVAEPSDCSFTAVDGIGVRFHSEDYGIDGDGKYGQWRFDYLRGLLWPCALWFLLSPGSPWYGGLSPRHGKESKTSWAAKGLCPALYLLVRRRDDFDAGGNVEGKRCPTVTDWLSYGPGAVVDRGLDGGIHAIGPGSMACLTVSLPSVCVVICTFWYCNSSVEHIFSKSVYNS